MRTFNYRLFFICCSIFLTLQLPSIGQTLNFGIYKGKDQIGKLTVEKVVSTEKTFYQANSESHFSLLFNNEFITQSRAEFVNNVLAFCMSRTLHNGKVRDHSITQKSKDGYTLTSHSEEEINLKHPPVKISTLNLYFLEPIGVNWIFSENYQELCPLKPLGSHTYEVTFPGGKVNHYIYENGSLVEIKVFRTFVDLSFKLQQSEG